MSEGPAAPTAGCYQLPEDAHLTLEQARDRLYLLARLAAPRSPHDDLPEAELPLGLAALAHCFEELADQLDRSLQAACWSKPPPRAGDPGEPEAEGARRDANGTLRPATTPPHPPPAHGPAAPARRW